MFGNKDVTCLKCGWVHREVSREYAERQSHEFVDWYHKQNEEIKKMYGSSPSYTSMMYNYEHCFRCGAMYKEFRDSKLEDCPDGCTLGPIIDRRQ